MPTTIRSAERLPLSGCKRSASVSPGAALSLGCGSLIISNLLPVVDRRVILKLLPMSRLSLGDSAAPLAIGLADGDPGERKQRPFADTHWTPPGGPGLVRLGRLRAVRHLRWQPRGSARTGGLRLVPG